MHSQRRGNRHPVDQLGDIRQQIKTLQEREQVLREELFATGDLIGDEFEAEIRHSAQQRLNDQAAIKLFGRVTLAPFLRRIEFDVVRLRRRED